MARIDQGRLQARVAQADFFPELSSDPSWRRYRTSGNNAPQGGFPISSQTTSQFGLPFDLSYEIDLCGKVRRGFESARNEMLASVSAYQNILFTLQADVAATYYQVRSLDHEINLLQQAVDLRQENIKIFQARFDAGYSSELDVTSTKTLLAALRMKIPSPRCAKKRLLNSRFLHSLSSSQLLERRPDVAEAERKLVARNAEIGVAYAAFFPSLRLTTNAGLQSVELKDLF